LGFWGQPSSGKNESAENLANGAATTHFVRTTLRPNMVFLRFLVPENVAEEQRDDKQVKDPP
jgi:hypothetical protein